MNRFLLSCVLALAVATSVRATDPEELVLAKNEDGVTEFGLVYFPSERTVAASMTWNGYQLLKGRAITRLKLAIFSGAQRLTAWKDYDGTAATYDGDMGTNLLLSKNEASAVIRALRSARLVFSLDSESDRTGEYPATHFIDIGSLCGSFPGAFQNAETSESGCP